MSWLKIKLLIPQARACVTTCVLLEKELLFMVIISSIQLVYVPSGVLYSLYSDGNKDI